MHAKKDATQGSIEHGVPKAGEMAHYASADGAELIGDGKIGIVGVAQVATDAVELLRNEIKGDVVGFVGGEGEPIALLVIGSGCLKAGTGEGGVARWICIRFSGLTRVLK